MLEFPNLPRAVQKIKTPFPRKSFNYKSTRRSAAQTTPTKKIIAAKEPLRILTGRRGQRRYGAHNTRRGAGESTAPRPMHINSNIPFSSVILYAFCASFTVPGSRGKKWKSRLSCPCPSMRAPGRKYYEGRYNRLGFRHPRGEGDALCAKTRILSSSPSGPCSYAGRTRFFLVLPPPRLFLCTADVLFAGVFGI